MMQRELDALVATCPEDEREVRFARRPVNSISPVPLQAFTAEMKDFYNLFERYQQEKKADTVLDWDKIRSPDDTQIKSYSDLQVPPADVACEQLEKLAVLKLNGGLGTTMGCVGPKSAIEVRSGMTFLDLIVRQIEVRRQPEPCRWPLIPRTMSAVPEQHVQERCPAASDEFVQHGR